jgi:oligoendopeptidase F
MRHESLDGQCLLTGGDAFSSKGSVPAGLRASEMCIIWASCYAIARRLDMSQSTLVSSLDPTDLAQVEKNYQSLLDRSLTTVDEVEQWLCDVSDLETVLDEYGSRRYIDHTCHTEDEEIEKAYLHFVETIEPACKPWLFRLQQKFVELPCLDQLAPERYDVLRRRWTNAVELYRPENVPLETDETKLFSDYGKMCGAMLVDFQGESRTVQQMAKFMEVPDRAVRQEAWQAVQDRRAQDQEAMDDIFSRLLSVREKISLNAGYDNYRAYAFRQRERFDYGPEECLRFGDAIADHCVPLLEELDRARAKRLGLSSLRPWDLSVDPQGRPPLRPFEEGDIDSFVDKTRSVFERISPELGQQFRGLKMGRNLDLDSRRGKRPGGYQASLEALREPFIFMNAVGTQRDVVTLLHEGGHAFHYLEARDEPLLFLRHAPMEFCEVASMSMELLGSSAFDVFYGSEEAERALRDHLEGIIRFLPWMATVDGFQHWLYTHPGHSSTERQEAWLEIQARFLSSVVDWAGLDQALRWRWQPQLHIFGMPFYYVEYGIAQLGALQVWLNYRKAPDQALTELRRAFALGGRRPLPELFETAGLRFDFSAATLEPLLHSLGQSLKSIGA